MPDRFTTAGGHTPPPGPRPPGRPRTRTAPTRRLQVDIPADLMAWLIATAGPGKLSSLVVTVLQAVREEAEQAAQWARADAERQRKAAEEAREPAGK